MKWGTEAMSIWQNETPPPKTAGPETPHQRLQRRIAEEAAKGVKDGTIERGGHYKVNVDHAPSCRRRKGTGGCGCDLVVTITPKTGGTRAGGG